MKADKEEASAPELPVVPQQKTMFEKPFLMKLSDLVETVKKIPEAADQQAFKDFYEYFDDLIARKGKSRAQGEAALKKRFRELYDKFRDAILKEDFDFLKKETVVLEKDKMKKIPLSVAYSLALEKYDEHIDTMEACLLLIFSDVCPDDDIVRLAEICSNFDPEEEEGGSVADMIQEVIGTVSNTLQDEDLELEDGSGGVNPEAMGDVFNKLIKSEGMQRSFKKMIGAFGSEEFDPNKTIQDLMGLGKKPSKKQSKNGKGEAE